jgi:hypothetical protein
MARKKRTQGQTMLEIDSEVRLKTKFYDKRDGFNFPIVSFPSLCNIGPHCPFRCVG